MDPKLVHGIDDNEDVPDIRHIRPIISLKYQDWLSLC